MAPVLRAYQVLLYPVVKPSALLLDAWLGRESPEYFRENVIRDMLQRHVEHHDTDVEEVEGLGAINFLEIDEVPASQEGSPIVPATRSGIQTQMGDPY